MFVKGMTKSDFWNALGETNEDVDDILDGIDEAPVSAFGDDFEDEGD